MENIKKIGIGNYRGNLHIGEANGKFFWAVECDLDDKDDWEWAEIPQSLYFEISKFVVNEDDEAF